MKKLLTTLLFIGVFSQVSLSQIWESDTLPYALGVKRYKNIVHTKDFRNIFFATGGRTAFYTTWTNTFGQNFTISRANTCCLNNRYQLNFQSDISFVNADTFFARRVFDPYGVPQNTIGLGNESAFYRDSGKVQLHNIGIRQTQIRYGIGGIREVITLSIPLAFHHFNSGRGIFSFGKEDDGPLRDTFSYTGLWRLGSTALRASAIQTKYPILDFAFLNDNYGFCGGYAGYLGKTNDGGLNWTKLIPPVKADWTDVFFADSLNGWAYGNFVRDTTGIFPRTYPVAVYTGDGGNTWFQIACDTNYSWQKKWFNSQGFGWALREWRTGGGSELVKTTDYGQTWSVQLSSLVEKFEDMIFADSSNGMIFANRRNVNLNPPSKIYIKTSSTLGTFKKYLPKLELYPNPTSGRFWLRGYKEDEGLTLRIFSNSGKEVWRGVPSPEGEVDISNLSPGLYHVEALTTSGKRWSTRVVRE